MNPYQDTTGKLNSALRSGKNQAIQKQAGMDTKKWTEQITEITSLFKTEFGHLTAAELNWKSDGKTWSIAQNMDHLIVINGTYYSVIDSVRKGNYKLPWFGKVGFLVNFFGKFLLKFVQPDRKRKIKTFTIWEPKKSNIDGAIVSEFEKQQSRLKEFIQRCEDLLDARIVIFSPANRNIVYTLETAFDIIVTHERRHLEQAREVYKLQFG